MTNRCILKQQMWNLGGLVFGKNIPAYGCIIIFLHCKLWKWGISAELEFVVDFYF